ncbi:MAG: Rpn family recombination-promoting nuclease/putative transposase [Bacteroidota bacterium]|nr:Rpn family recombination-promoting nuclease/putative transposase [Bacteroidota bacterium]
MIFAHDSFFKNLFSVKENLQDLLQGTLPRELISRAHLDTLEYDPSEYVDRELDPYFRDITCNMLYGDKRIKISLLYEHKSYPSKSIHLQLLRYILNVWESQQSSKQELTPVIAIVFYHGKQRWTRQEIVKNIPEELKRFVPLFDYVLFDTKDIEDHAIIQHFKRPNVKIGVWFMKRSDNLIGFIQENPLLAREILREIRNIEKTNIQRILFYLYNVSGMEPEKIDRIMETISPESKDVFEEYRTRLIEQGIEQGLKEIAVNMITRGYSNEQITEITKLSIKRIRILRKELSV